MITMQNLSPENITELRKAFIQDNTEKWLSIMAKKDAKHSGAFFVGFSFPAALFGQIWMVYRKAYNYLPAFIFIVIFSLIPDDSFNLFILIILLVFGFGYGGPHWYWLNTNREINHALSTSGSDLEKAKSILRERGGVSVPAVIITTIIYLIYQVLF